MWFLIVVLLASVGAGVVWRARSQGRSGKRWPGARRARWAALAYPLIQPFGWVPSFAAIAWAGVNAVLACAVIAPTGRTRLPSRVRVGLAPADAERLGAYLDDLAADVSELTLSVARQRGWLAPDLTLLVEVDDSARPLSPVATPWRAGPAREVAAPYARTEDIRPARSPLTGKASAGAAPTSVVAGGTLLKTQKMNRHCLVGPNGHRHELAEGRTIIGRGSGAQIRLDDDERISRRHALVEVAGRIVTIVDIDSANGTTLNDRPLEVRSAIAAGDVIEVGSTVLRFEEANET